MKITCLSVNPLLRDTKYYTPFSKKTMKKVRDLYESCAKNLIKPRAILFHLCNSLTKYLLAYHFCQKYNFWFVNDLILFTLLLCFQNDVFQEQLKHSKITKPFERILLILKVLIKGTEQKKLNISISIPYCTVLIF